jgi:hypothetical protein
LFGLSGLVFLPVQWGKAESRIETRHDKWIFFLKASGCAGLISKAC